ncbi:hypothetical protein [Litoribrevibacter albus]|uniref:DUF983 domain-containing protein n=1 Tax=Litoribrevibacter albus TaxID=1473156 RepID=A0AA37SCA4_9GAMM|nr:hypothetical protein [Litoribrevibacter albus]GLQ32686.1 hypothetical protein GCM10007876_31650 [Litoribrevibacter albus]
MLKRERYECASCAYLFPTKDAIDGYPHGYPTGFLCPRCKVNLVETSASDEPDQLDFGWSFMIFSGLLIAFADHINWVTHFEGPLLNQAMSVLSVWLPVYLVFVVINRNALFSARVIYTRKVPKG